MCRPRRSPGISASSSSWHTSLRTAASLLDLVEGHVGPRLGDSLPAPPTVGPGAELDCTALYAEVASADAVAASLLADVVGGARGELVECLSDDICCDARDFGPFLRLHFQGSVEPGRGSIRGAARGARVVRKLYAEGAKLGTIRPNSAPDAPRVASRKALFLLGFGADDRD